MHVSTLNRLLSARWVSLVVALAVAAGPAVASAAPPKLSAEQEKAVEQVKAKGGSVMQLAADSDALVVNLGLAGKAVGDAEVAAVKALPKVVDLDLHGTGVTDKGLEAVGGMKELTRLRLDRTQVTDAGLAHLKGLSALTYLNLYDTPVTDAGLEHLKELKGLKRVYLWQTKVTDGGAEALRKALPDALVNRGEGMAALAAVAAEQAKADAAKKDPKATATAAAPAAGKPINAKCPVSGKDVDPTKTLAFEGKTIGFCCDKCPKQFEKEPTKFVSKLPELKTATAAKPEDKKPDDKKPAAPTAADLKPDDEGFLRAWLLLAPVPLADGDTGADGIDKEQVANEKALKPKAGDKAKAGDKELTWKAVKAADYHFDLNEILGQQNDNVAAYAVAYVDAADEKKDLNLLMGSNDQGKVYLNGKEVLKFTETRGIDKDQDKATGVTLNKGTNVIVFKVVNEANNWQGCIRFTDKDNKPVKDLKLKLEP